MNNLCIYLFSAVREMLSCIEEFPCPELGDEMSPTYEDLSKVRPK